MANKRKGPPLLLINCAIKDQKRKIKRNSDFLIKTKFYVASCDVDRVLESGIRIIISRNKVYLGNLVLIKICDRCPWSSQQEDVRTTSSQQEPLNPRQDNRDGERSGRESVGARLLGFWKYGSQANSDAYWDGRYAGRTKYDEYIKKIDREGVLFRDG